MAKYRVLYQIGREGQKGHAVAGDVVDLDGERAKRFLDAGAIAPVSAESIDPPAHSGEGEGGGDDPQAERRAELEEKQRKDLEPLAQGLSITGIGALDKPKLITAILEAEASQGSGDQGPEGQGEA